MFFQNKKSQKEEITFICVQMSELKVKKSKKRKTKVKYSYLKNIPKDSNKDLVLRDLGESSTSLWKLRWQCF